MFWVRGQGCRDVPIDLARMRQAPSARLEFFNLWLELRHESASLGLKRLIHLVGAGRLKPLICMEADWHEIGRVAQAFIDRQFPGKAVLHIP